MSGHNPFNPPKATDLSDKLVCDLWVAPGGVSSDGPILLDPKTQASFVLQGAKGCGKTHILRWHSSDVQRLRNNGRISAAAKSEGYLGIYILCRTIDAARFRGSELSQEQWDALFGYYLELWFAEIFVRLLLQYCAELQYPEERLFRACAERFTVYPEDATHNLLGMSAVVQKSRKEIDNYLNNVLFHKDLARPRILLSPGAAWFGLPEAAQSVIGNTFVTLLMLDEIENLSVEQQKVVQDRIRHRSGPVSLWVCGRPYGFRTWETTTRERNKPNAEFKKIDIAALWGDEEAFRTTAERICQKRLLAVGYEPQDTARALLEPQPTWEGIEQLILAGEQDGKLPKRIKRLHKALVGRRDEWINELTATIRKLNPLRQQSAIAAICAGRVAGPPDVEPRVFASSAEEVGAKLESHFAGDFRAQLVEESRVLPRQWEYCGWEGIVGVTNSNPRDLLSILGSAHDWWSYDTREKRRPSRGDISLSYQASAIASVSDLFEETAIESDIAGHGTRARRGVAALCKALAACRRATIPPQASPSTFSIPASGASNAVESALSAAKLYGLLEEHSRNHNNLKAKGSAYQISAQLCPKFGLPTARRGVLTISAQHLEVLFGNDQRSEALDEVVSILSGRGDSGKKVGSAQQISLFGVEDD